jgi:hypothetical protein
MKPFYVNWWRVLGLGICILGAEMMLLGIACLTFLEPHPPTFSFWRVLGMEHLFMLALATVVTVFAAGFKIVERS